MSLYATSIRRPVLATVMSLVIIIFGVIGFFFLGVREYPNLESPVISVSTSYRGANADVIDSQITEPLEESINGIDGIRTLTSVSREGRSSISVEFNLGADLERAANDVRDRVSQAQRFLPADVDPPVVSKADADGQPIIGVSVYSQQRDLLELSDIADNILKERLQTIPGVSRVDIWGEKRFSMRMWIDPAKLAAYRLTASDVRNALNRANIELPSGRIEGETVELGVRTLSRLQTVEDFENLILKESGGTMVRFKDIGRAELAPENLNTLLMRDGIPMVMVVVRPLPGANSISIADEFYERLETIKVDLPSDIETVIGFDNTVQIRKSIFEVQETVLIAFILVVCVIFFFLRDWRTTIIPIVAIPVSLIGAFFIMYLAGFTINILTLLAIVLAIGIVVDDAIVVLENIYTKVEAGLHPVAAGIEGTKEIFFAIIATTLSLVAVFLPVIFMGGITGRLFREFGIVMAGSIAISAFVALTLTPMLSSKLLKHREQMPWFYRVTEPFFQRMTNGYRNSLESFMRRRWLAFPSLLACGVLCYVLFNALPSELAPLEDRAQLRLNATAPEGASYEYMTAYMNHLLELTQDEVPEREAIVSITAPGFGGGSMNSGFLNLMLKPATERERSQQEIAGRLTARVKTLSGARVSVSQDETISVGRRGGLPLQFVIQAPNLAKLEEVVPTFMEVAQDDPAFAFVDVNLKFNKPELTVHINRERAQTLGVSVLDVSETLQFALSEARLGYFIRNGQQYQILAQAERDYRSETLDLRSLYVRTSSGEPVSLDNLVTVTEESRPPQLYRFNRFSSATISAQLSPGYTIADGIEAMQRIATETLDDTYQTALAGTSRDYVESSNSLAFIFLLALVLIYLILAGQFESFRDPFIILLTVPLALTGALLSLWYFNQTLNIFSQIGMVMLIGLVTKNGILIVEFANVRKEAGRSVIDAALDASAARFRPIIMTSLATVLGILPIALALGAGAESRVPMGIVVVGGLTIGTVFTLYVIPAIYTFLTSRHAASPMLQLSDEELMMSGDGGSGVVASERPHGEAAVSV